VKFIARLSSIFPLRIQIRRDLGFQLLALYLLFVGPVTTAALIFDHLASARIQADVKAADLALARAIGHETDAILGNAILTVESLAQYPVVRQADIPGMETLFQNIADARPDVNLIYRLAPDGIMLFHHPIGLSPTLGVDFSFREYFQDALLTTQAVISKGRISPTTHQAVATTVMPLWNSNGEFQGVVATNIRLETLSKTLASIAQGYQPNEGFEVSIIDSTGQIIASPNVNLLLEPLGEDLSGVIGDVLNGLEGNTVSKDSDKKEWLTSFVPIPSGNWGVVIRRPTTVAFASARAFRRGVIVAVSIFLLGGVLFWIALNRQVMQPIERLTAFSQSLSYPPEKPSSAREDIAPLSMRLDQMGHLVRSFTRMEESIEKRLTELSTLLETSKAVVSTLDSQIVLDRILEQTSRLVGAETCAIVALEDSSREFRIKASRGLSDSYIQRLRIDPTDPRSPSMRAIRSRQPIQISDVETDPTFVHRRARARAEGVRALLSVPLLLKHTSPAALLVYFKEPHTFSQREVSLVSNFANHAAMAIENAALYARSDERLQEQTRRLEALVQSMGDGLILENLDGRVFYCNRRVCDLANLTPDQAQQASAVEIRERLFSHAIDAQAVRTSLEDALRARGSRNIEWTMIKGSRQITLRLRTFDVTDSHGEVIGRGQFIQDITRDRELDRMKNSLIATVSHELRTPLAAIKGYATTLLADDVQWDLETQNEFLTVISQETDRLSDFVSNLLDLSRLESGSLSIDRADCVLPEIIDKAVRRARPSPNKNVAIDIDPDFPQLYVDPQRIESVFQNLLENAAKYAGGNASVRISARVEDGGVVMRIEDEGPGIPAAYANRVFEPFFRLDDRLNRTASGAGLGLSICRGFVHAHGGEIWLEQRVRGTCVAFSLPKEAISKHG
jgi:signal transduction histidine kinase